MVHVTATSVCRLCGSSRDVLTREHIPARSAGNSGRHTIEFFRVDSTGQAKLELPDGFALSVLCKSCNSRYGSSLGTSFADFVQQVQSSGRFVSPRGGAFVCAMDVYPSRVLRQLLLNFLCIQPLASYERWESVRKYIRSRGGGVPPDAPRVGLYCNISNTYRVVPVGVVGALGRRSEPWVGAEIAAPGLGVVFTLGDPRDANPVITPKLLDITPWGDQPFSARERVTLELARYRVEVPHPLAFGSRREVDKWQTRNMIAWLANRFDVGLDHEVAGILWKPQRMSRR